jgi:CRISPR-associated protein Csd1
MILQALKEYYDRKAADSGVNMAPEGFERKELQFLIVIDNEGNFINLEDIRERVQNRIVAKSFLLPRSKGRSGIRSYETTFLLWDHIGYVLGLPENDAQAIKQHQAWLNSLAVLPKELLKDEGVNAVLKFYQNGAVNKAITSPLIIECLKSLPCNISFRLVTDLTPVPCRKLIKDYVSMSSTDEVTSPKGTCLVTGEKGVIARTHGKTFINKDSWSLVGFQKKRGYDSYGKEQGFNAPIIKSTEFAYVTALNTLLKSGTQRFQVGDTTILFWSEKESSFERDFASFFKKPEKDNPDAGTQRVKALFKSVFTGTYLEDKGDMRFYILGLSPNAARISVRNWHMGTVLDFATRIRQYFEDFAIIKPPQEPENYSLFDILTSIATQGEIEKIPPNLAGDFIRAIFNGTPYPFSMLPAAIRRFRDDHKEVKPVQAALIKACLNRYQRFYPDTTQKEVCFDLDPDQPSAGYQLGRLFAALEKIQEEASPTINATIRERYYGAACATPVTVFPILLRLKNHHLAKIENKGRVVNFERLLGTILSKIQDFPVYFNLHEQGRFAIGYYHQRQAFFTPKETATKDCQE